MIWRRTVKTCPFALRNIFTFCHNLAFKNDVEERKTNQMDREDEQ